MLGPELLHTVETMYSETLCCVKQAFSEDMFPGFRQKTEVLKMTQKWCTELSMVIEKARSTSIGSSHLDEAPYLMKRQFYQNLDMFFEQSVDSVPAIVSQQLLRVDPLTYLKKFLMQLGEDANISLVEMQWRNMYVIMHSMEIEIEYLSQIQELSVGCLSKLKQAASCSLDFVKCDQEALRRVWWLNDMFTVPRFRSSSSPARKKNRLHETLMPQQNVGAGVTMVTDKEDVKKIDDDDAGSGEETEKRQHSVDGLKVDSDENHARCFGYDPVIFQELYQSVLSIKLLLASRERILMRMLADVWEQQKVIRKARLSKKRSGTTTNARETNDGSDSRQFQRRFRRRFQRRFRVDSDEIPPQPLNFSHEIDTEEETFYVDSEEFVPHQPLNFFFSDEIETEEETTKKTIIITNDLHDESMTIRDILDEPMPVFYTSDVFIPTVVLDDDSIPTVVPDDGSIPTVVADGTIDGSITIDSYVSDGSITDDDTTINIDEWITKGETQPCITDEIIINNEK